MEICTFVVSFFVFVYLSASQEMNTIMCLFISVPVKKWTLLCVCFSQCQSRNEHYYVFVYLSASPEMNTIVCLFISVPVKKWTLVRVYLSGSQEMNTIVFAYLSASQAMNTIMCLLISAPVKKSVEPCLLVLQCQKKKKASTA